MNQRPAFCFGCPINRVTEGYIPLHLGVGSEMLVGKAAREDDINSGQPLSGGQGQWLNSILKSAHLGRTKFHTIDTIGCRPPLDVYPDDDQFSAAAQQLLVNRLAAERGINLKKQPELRHQLELEAGAPSNAQGRAAIDYCRQHHLLPAIEQTKPSRILALGEEALRATTARRNIYSWRGSPLALRGAPSTLKVVPTLHPLDLASKANLFSVCVQDFKRTLALPPEHYNLWATLDDLKAFNAKEFSFDFEWDNTGNITICGLSDRYYHALVVSFCEPFISELKRIFENATTLIGQNIIGADTKYFERLGWRVNAKMVDIMLIQHLVQPDMKHDLGFIASVFSSKVFWKGRGEEFEDEDGNLHATGAQYKTWDSPDAIPRELGGYGGCTSSDEAFRLYNARDTEGSLQCVSPLLATLKNFQLENTYWNVSVPTAYLCREMGDHGLKVNNAYVGNVRDDIAEKIAKVEKDLPPGLAPYEQPITKQIDAPPNTFKPKGRVCKGGKKFGGKHEPVELLFEQPGTTQKCGSCNRELEAPKLQLLRKIKVPDVQRVVPWNSAEQVKKYALGLGCKPYINSKTGRSTADKNARKTWGREHVEFAAVDQLKKLSTQYNSFAKPALVEVPRVYFNLLVHGTSEGRLSSSGQRRGIDPNIQNQPKSIRKIFIPDEEGWGILDSDVIQGENMITAWLAKDWVRWEKLNTPGFDEHSYMASRFFNCEVTKDNDKAYLRAPGKIINHGRNYGLGVRKTVEYLAAQGFFYTEADVKEMIEIWKKENKRTAQWQQETIETAQRQSFLENAFGRRRWFQGRDFATKALAFLPASTLADVVLRCMIALHPHRFAEQIAALRLRVVGALPKPWFLNIQVHDSLVCQGPDELHLETARVIRAVMTQPWAELDGFRLGVEQAYSTKSWGDVKKIELDDAPPMLLAA